VKRVSMTNPADEEIEKCVVIGYDGDGGSAEEFVVLGVLWAFLIFALMVAAMHGLI